MPLTSPITRRRFFHVNIWCLTYYGQNNAVAARFVFILIFLIPSVVAAFTSYYELFNDKRLCLFVSDTFVIIPICHVVRIPKFIVYFIVTSYLESAIAFLLFTSRINVDLLIPVLAATWL